MSEKIDLQQAIKEAMQTEKDAMDYYKYAAEKMFDEKANVLLRSSPKRKNNMRTCFTPSTKGTMSLTLKRLLLLNRIRNPAGGKLFNKP